MAKGVVGRRDRRRSSGRPRPYRFHCGWVVASRCGGAGASGLREGGSVEVEVAQGQHRAQNRIRQLPGVARWCGGRAVPSNAALQGSASVAFLSSAALANRRFLATCDGRSGFPRLPLGRFIILVTTPIVELLSSCPARPLRPVLRDLVGSAPWELAAVRLAQVSSWLSRSSRVTRLRGTGSVDAGRARRRGGPAVVAPASSLGRASRL